MSGAALIAARTLPAGTLVAEEDVQPGAGEALAAVRRAQSERRVLAADVPEGAPISPELFRPARVGTIVACRMKSSRLKRKALLPLGGVASVDRCLHQCVRFPGEVTVLATSIDPEDEALGAERLGGKVPVFRGHPEDVIRRYVDAADAHGIDVFIRATADCPVVLPEIAEILLDSHFAAGADYSAPRSFSVGTNSEIYNVEALRRVLRMMGEAPYSEYMTWYMTNNPDIFKINVVDLPDELVRDYRLTLDYQEDADLFDALFERLERQGLEPTGADIFAILDADPELAAVNKGMPLRYRSDTKLIDELNRATRIPASAAGAASQRPLETNR